MKYFILLIFVGFLMPTSSSAILAPVSPQGVKHPTHKITKRPQNKLSFRKRLALKIAQRKWARIQSKKKTGPLFWNFRLPRMGIGLKIVLGLILLIGFWALGFYILDKSL